MNPAQANRLRIKSAASLGSAWLAPLQEWWSSLQDRERRLLGIGAAVVGATLLWLLALQPPLQLIQQSAGRLDALEAQTQNMQRLAVEARELRAAPQVSAAQSVAALRAASDRLGERAKLTVQGDRAVLSFDGLESDSLRAWLGEVRSGARGRAVDAQLSRGAKGFSGSVTVAIGGSP